MTKGQIDALLELLGKLEVGTNDGDVARTLRSTQSDALLT